MTGTTAAPSQHGVDSLGGEASPEEYAAELASVTTTLRNLTIQGWERAFSNSSGTWAEFIPMDFDPFDFVTPSDSFSFHVRDGEPDEPELWEQVVDAEVALAIADAFRYAPETCIEWMKEQGFGVGLERGLLAHWEARLRDSFRWGRRFRVYRRK